MMDYKAELLDRIVQSDVAGAIFLLRTWGEQFGYRHLMEELLLPTLQRFTVLHGGSRDAPLARCYVAARVASEAMEIVAQAMPTPPELLRGPVVLGNAENDFHGLGRRIVSVFLRAAGWRIFDLGNDVPAEEFVDRARQIGARVIGVSAMMYETAQNIRRIRTELQRQGLERRIRLAVGGAVFVLRPELVAEVGADGTARVATEAPRLFAELWDSVSGEEHPHDQS